MAPKKRSHSTSGEPEKTESPENKAKRKPLQKHQFSKSNVVQKEEEDRREGEKRGGAEGLQEVVRQARLRTAPSVLEFRFNKQRVRLISQDCHLQDQSQAFVYWMSRDQRVQDNWALLYAQRLALKQKLPLHVCFCLAPCFLGATIRHYDFMLRGLEEVAEVDAHNIVPCWVASDKQEYGARTIRHKIHDRLPHFLTEFPPVICHPYPSNIQAEPVDWNGCRAGLQVDRSVKEVSWAKPGTASGLTMLQSFIAERLPYFGSDRNNPNKDALSNLSPWFHFGQVSVQRAILEVQKHRSRYPDSVANFVEEAVVRRELADNFCFYNKNYDKLEGAYDWAQTTLRLHAKDKRPHLYSLEQLESGKTHDPLWNAAQMQMVKEGKMHGFLRMYWAKKILEWTRSPEEALEFAIYLNDRFQLDGRDPNGYVGCMWSICGIHDQGWAEREVFGKIRYMNYAGCKRKFDVAEFERKYSPAD
ncbi:deoxyribodipyrimidine photo-lyase isoform X2 [Petaurus breviceps papuanus]|uniref:deoxyribodipyrimidine photo-lyase isoform X2 n=1 Tax=Petaurus breviceps papuanus TaxID=3040969 RepID=UPI0036D7E6E5